MFPALVCESTGDKCQSLLFQPYTRSLFLPFFLYFSHFPFPSLRNSQLLLLNYHTPNRPSVSTQLIMNLNLIAILGLVLSVTGLATSSSTDDANHEAPLAVSNPRKLFEAKLLDKSNTTIRGLVNIWSQPVGVKVHVDFWGLPQNTSLRKFPLPTLFFLQMGMYLTNGSIPYPYASSPLGRKLLQHRRTPRPVQPWREASV